MIEKDLPRNIAIFPLSNAVFFPRTVLPLNIFEDRYIQLINDCMKEQRLFGMVQPKSQNKKIPEVYDVGCLGKIVSFNETQDNRFVISLSGLIRFKIEKEITSNKLYRKFNVNYSNFINDLNDKKSEKIKFNKISLLNKIKIYFEKKNYAVEFNELVKLDFEQLISTTCMVSPFSIQEKQKLIETVNMEDKAKTLEEIINFNLMDIQENKTIQ
jgi:uncharacterized protein